MKAITRKIRSSLCVSLVLLAALVFGLAAGAANATAYLEDFETGYQDDQSLNGQPTGNPQWFTDGSPPVKTDDTVGIGGTWGLTKGGQIFIWEDDTHRFRWQDNNLAGVIMAMDFQASDDEINDDYKFDDDRIGWMITNSATGSSNFFGVQLDPSWSTDSINLVIEGYWDSPTVTDARPFICDVPEVPELTSGGWYRFQSEFLKLTDTSARINVELWSLDSSGDPDALITSGSITDTGQLPSDLTPHTDYFNGDASGYVWPAYKNYNDTAGAADNTYFETLDVMVDVHELGGTAPFREAQVIEAGSGDNFRVKLSEAPDPGTEVTVTFGPIESWQDIVLEESGQPVFELSFTNSNWDSYREITINAQDDFEVERNETAMIYFTVSSDDSDFDDAWVSPIKVTIVDNETTDHIRNGPYLMYTDDNTEMKIMCRMVSTWTGNCKLKWGKGKTYSDGTVTLTPDGDNRVTYVMGSSSSLETGTKYYYQITDGQVPPRDDWEYTGSFYTASDSSAGDVKFSAYGDTRTYPQRHDAVCKGIVETFTTDPAYQTFMLHVGDWVEYGNTESQWDNQYFSRTSLNTRQMLANLPIQGCVGNHEFEGGSTLFGDYWPYPFLESGTFYGSFDYGPVHVAVVDTETNMGSGSAQDIWLKGDMYGDYPWKIIVLHRPGWSAGGHADNTSVQGLINRLEDYLEANSKAGTDILFAGHNHYYARCETSANEVIHITTGAGGAPFHTPDDEYPSQSVDNVILGGRYYHSCEVYIRDKVLRFRARDISGGKIDVFTLLHDGSHYYVDGVNGSDTGNDGLSWANAFKTIQKGINTAGSSGDLIEVAEGTYNESIDFSGKSVIVTSTDPEDPDTVDKTVIYYYNGNYSKVVKFVTSENANSILTGFTIRSGGVANWPYGIYCSGSNPTIRNCTIEDAYFGIYCYNSTSEIRNCVIRNDRYGVWCSSSAAKIKNNWIYNHYQGILMLGNSPAKIRNNLIYDCDWGVENYGSGSPEVIGNTIVDNGYGVWKSSTAAAPTITNCILWGNTNDLYNCSATYSCIEDGDAGDGNIQANPSFVDAPNHNYHLRPGSPCTDAGYNNVEAGETDIDGDPRKQEGCVDMGADETPNNGHLYVKVGGGSDGRTWETAMGSIQEAINAASDGDIIDVNVGTYYESINFNGKAITLRSIDPLNLSVVEATVIDGDSSGTVVTFNSGETSASVLDGFTIANGDSTYGGGIDVYNSSPTIRNCIIRDNYAGSRGGGMYNNNGSPTLSRCIFRDNESYMDAGGLDNWNGNVTVTNCMFVKNDAGYNGGAINNYDDMTITNCTFSGNTATSYGGAIYNGGDMTLTNSILWGDYLNGEPDEIYNGNNIVVTYCDVQGGWSGTGNINSNPQFVDYYNYDYHLATSSPCIDVGDQYGTYNGQVDIDGDERVIDIASKGNGTVDVDMGADEVAGNVHNITQDNWYFSIQQAINCALNYEVIEINQGTYYENIYLYYSGNITLRSTDPNDWSVVEATVINGSNSGAVVTFNIGGTYAPVLDGLTIADGNNSHGGGIYISSSPPYSCNATIRNCIIRDNYAGSRGGGMYNNNGSPTLSRCIFRDNESHMDAGGLDNWSGNVTVTNCMFVKNDAGYNGGAISNYDDMTITNCTFSGNTALSYGGAIYHSGYMTLTNSILWGDTLNGQPDEIQGNPYVSYCDVEGGWYGTGNIDADPLFVDPNNYDYHIEPNSPCIDVGDPTGDYTGEVDIDGEERVIDIVGKGDGIVDVDIGADEKTCNEITYDWHVKPDGNDTDDGKSWDTAFATISHAISEASNNDIIGVAEGTYYENINFNGKDITILSTDPLNWSVVEATVIDANNSGTVVTFNNGETSTSILDGFTIANGNSSYGGGIYVYGASPTIHNCIIRDNYGGSRGGGMYNNNGSPTLSRCIFRDNESRMDAGGLDNWNGNVTVTNCMFVKNDAGYNGGAINNYDNMTITNCTFSGNTASSYGGAIYNSDYMTLTNSILWGDTLNGEPDEIESYYGSVYVSYCDVEGGWSGTGNINADPLFADPNNYNYHIEPNSPCIDVGNPNGSYSGQVDIDGDDRLIDIAGKGDGIIDVDMGTDEYKPN